MSPQQLIENPRVMPVNELIGKNFFIPRYQRGYRWGEQEITDLLEDILQYHLSVTSKNKDVKPGQFYCIQPFVVKSKHWKNQFNEEKEGWELIDGQQRLTTIYIILSYLEDIRQFYDGKYEIYDIDFETRENCKSFFLNKQFIDNIDDSNVDFYHISKAYEIVKDWFKDKLILRLDILKTILETSNNVSLIWYEAKNSNTRDLAETNSIDLFTRLNDGKIPLTDAELIKALLLQADKYPANEMKYIHQRLFEIASEWDEIESTLNDKKIWLFLNDIDYNPSSKIEFLFALLADKWNNEYNPKLVDYKTIDGKPKHFEYLVFDRYLAKKHNEFIKSVESEKDILDPVNSIWKQVKELYETCIEWYNDHNLYHYIGFLFATNPPSKEKIIKDLLSYRHKNKTEFYKIVVKMVGEIIKIKELRENQSTLKELHELSYGKENDRIIKILLLFNIETLVNQKKEDARFPFYLYKTERITSIEHIHPQNPDEIDTDEFRSQVWLTSHRRSLVTLYVNSQLEEIKVLIDGIDDLLVKYNKEAFRIIYQRILDYYSTISKMKENEMHTLYNLALVDKDTNSSLNNSFFDIKREILKENKLKRYIPPCTLRAFSKYYSTSPMEMMFWSDDDRKSYFKEIQDVYTRFIS